MDGCDSATSYLLNNDVYLDVDFESFSSDTSFNHFNGQPARYRSVGTLNRPTMMATSNEYKRLNAKMTAANNTEQFTMRLASGAGWQDSNMTAMHANEDPWDNFQYQATNNNHSVCSDAKSTISTGKPKSSTTDSGYGSISYLGSDNYGTGHSTSAETNNDNAYHPNTMYCELCYEETGTKRHFNNTAEKKKHMCTHSRPYKCDLMGCNNSRGFASTHDLARHKKSCHSVLTTKTSKFYYRCAAPSCRKKDKVWPRKDNFKAHLEGTHKCDAMNVAQLLKMSECMPDPSMLPPISNPPRQPKRRKVEPMPEAHLPFQSSTASTTSYGTTELSGYHGLQGLGALFDGIAPGTSSDDLMLLDPPHCTFQGEAPSPTSDAPRIVVTGQPGMFIRKESTSSVRSINMLDERATPAGSTGSPFILIQPSPPSPDWMSFASTPEPDYEPLVEPDIDDSVTDVDLEGETSKVQPVFQPLMPEAVQRLFSAYQAFRQLTNGGQGQQSNSGRRSSSGGQHQDNHLGIGPSRQSSTRKRGRKIDKDEEDGNEERRPKRKGRAEKPDEEQLPLACPFNKHNPHEYGKCYKYFLNNISRVKQHLKRIHSLPLYCPRCYTTFGKNSNARDQHARLGACTNLPERIVPGISEAKMRLLECRAVGPTPQDSWYAIYDLLFPGASRPDSPFIDRYLSVELCHFRDFCNRQGREVVTGMIEQSAPFLICTPDQLNEFVQQVHQRVLQELFLQYQQVNQSFPPPSSSNNSVSPSRRPEAPSGAYEGVTQQPTPPANRLLEQHQYIIAGGTAMSRTTDEDAGIAVHHDLGWVDGEQEQQHRFMSHDTYDIEGFGVMQDFANMGDWTGHSF